MCSAAFGLGHDVTALVSNGAALLESIKDSRPDLVIADVAMPIMDGIEACEQIWEIDPLPLMLISGHYGEQFANRARLDFAMVFLTKPFTIPTLAAALEDARRRFAHFCVIRSHCRNDRDALRARRVVEQATLRVARATQLDDEGAFQWLQKLADARQTSVIDVARQINLLSNNSSTADE